MERAEEARRAAPSGRVWAAWAALTAISYGALALALFPTTFTAFRSAVAPFWMTYTDMVIAPAVGIAAAVLPIGALVALLFRRFHVTALVGMAVCVALLLAYFGLQTYWASQSASWSSILPSE
jgi:hypothetical protein